MFRAQNVESRAVTAHKLTMSNMQACTACARTKTKCDQQVPCGRCQSRGLVCTPRPTRRHFQQVDSLADAPFFDSEIVSDHDSEGVDPESTITVTGGNVSSQDALEPSENADLSGARHGAELPARSEHLPSQICATNVPTGQPMEDVGANHTPSQPAMPSSFLSPMSMPPDHPENGLGRYFSGSLLPQLDWQSLASDAAPSEDPNQRRNGQALGRYSWNPCVGRSELEPSGHAHAFRDCNC